MSNVCFMRQGKVFLKNCCVQILKRLHALLSTLLSAKTLTLHTHTHTEMQVCVCVQLLYVSIVSGNFATLSPSPSLTSLSLGKQLARLLSKSLAHLLLLPPVAMATFTPFNATPARHLQGGGSWKRKLVRLAFTFKRLVFCWYKNWITISISTLIYMFIACLKYSPNPHFPYSSPLCFLSVIFTEILCLL